MTALADRLRPLARTTAFRLAALYVALFVAAAAAAAVGLVWRTNALLTADTLRTLRGERAELVSTAEVRGLEGLGAIVAERSRTVSGTLYFLADARGAKLAGNLSQRPPELAPDAAGGLFPYASTARGGPGHRLAAGLITPTPGGGTLVLARDVEDQRRLLDGMRNLLLWGFASLAGVGIAGGILASRLVLKRIEAVNTAARGIMAGDLQRRIPLTGSGDELDDLAASLNAMLERIDQLMAGIREVSDNIAHDLKTPLNRLRSRAEAALRDERGSDAWREGLERTIEDADELIRTFNALLLIARLEAGAVDDSFATFELGAVVRDVAELYEPVADAEGLTLAADIAVEVKVRANRELIGQAVANLVDNAIKYSARAEVGRAECGAVRVDVRSVPGRIEVTVADRGPGIGPQDRERALRRFVRLDSSRSQPGTGLGLSLVAAVARLHGGSLRLEDNQPGLRVVLSLPDRLVVAPLDQAPTGKPALHSGGRP